MEKSIRQYIKEHGRVKARKKFGDVIDSSPITWEGADVGTVVREWHGVYCCWTWRAVISWNGLIHSYTSTVSNQECLDWAERKIKCLKNPEFGKALKEMIDTSGFTVLQVCEEVGCSREVMYKWMSGHSHPHIHFLVRICRMLAVLDWEPVYTELSEIIELERG